VSINVFTVSGRLGQRPMLKKFPDGGQVAEFTLAHKRRGKDRATGERKPVTDWYACNLWGPLAEILCVEAIRGQVITVTGQLAQESYERDGIQVPRPEISVASFELGRRPAGGEGEG